MAEPATRTAPDPGRRFKQRILGEYFVRFHMGLILAAVTASGVLFSKGLLWWGVASLRLRYPIAVGGSYLVFLLLVRVWIWYVSRAREPGPECADVVDSDVTAYSGSSNGGSGSFDLDAGDDTWILVLLAAVILAMVFGGGYLIYAAPEILPEAAFQALLVPVLGRVSKQPDHGWMPGVLRRTALPFAIVLVLAGALGWVAESHCPQAVKLMEAMYCGVGS